MRSWSFLLLSGNSWWRRAGIVKRFAVVILLVQRLSDVATQTRKFSVLLLGKARVDDSRAQRTAFSVTWIWTKQRTDVPDIFAAAW